MTDEPDGVYDWPHAVGTESKAELLAEIARLRESRDTAADVLLEIAGIVDIKAGSIPKAVQDLKDECVRLRGLLEAADEFIYLARNLNSRGPTRSRLALARYDKLKGE